MSSAKSELHGVLVVDKPAGMTSHDVVARVRRAAGQKSVGHAGTLDPMASGVLVVLLGEATKLTPWVTADDKAYACTLQLGVDTTSGDADGDVVQEEALCESLVAGLAAVAAGAPFARLSEAVETERARSLQVPPAVSAGFMALLLAQSVYAFACQCCERGFSGCVGIFLGTRLVAGMASRACLVALRRTR
jgi:tRNA pseudouridine55 synthase